MTSPARDLPLDPERLQRRIDELGAIGEEPGRGLFRGAYTPAWAAAVALVRGWLEGAGLRVWQDAAGNLFGRVDGTESGPAILAGSHIDTVPNGGRYDGALGVHAAIAAVEALVRQHGAPRRPVEVVAICDEEGSRFGTDFWGARAITGEITPAEAGAHDDAGGVTLAEAMRDAGLDPARLGEARHDDVAAWLELHIEQGATLEEDGLEIGAVEAITGHHGARVEVRGRQDHAGTTPMDRRRDAMAGAAEMIGAAQAVAERMGRPAVCTTGWIEAHPGAPNVVPGVVLFSIDVRHADPARYAELTGGVAGAITGVAERRGIEVRFEGVVDRPPVVLDGALREMIAGSAQALGLRWRQMPSMAGHDSQVMASRWPAAMVFVPSHDGRSHTPAEYTPVEQVIPGVRVLADVLHRLAWSA